MLDRAAYGVARDRAQRANHQAQQLARAAPPRGTRGGGGSDPADEARDDATLVLQSALEGDGEAVVSAFDAVVGRRGMVAAYDIAWRLAGEMVGDGIATGPWRLDFPDIEDAPYDTRWVARFVSAYANG